MPGGAWDGSAGVPPAGAPGGPFILYDDPPEPSHVSLARAANLSDPTLAAWDKDPNATPVDFGDRRVMFPGNIWGDGAGRYYALVDSVSNATPTRGQHATVALFRAASPSFEKWELVNNSFFNKTALGSAVFLPVPGSPGLELNASSRRRYMINGNGNGAHFQVGDFDPSSLTLENVSEPQLVDKGNWAWVTTGYAADGRMVQLGWMNTAGSASGYASSPSRLTCVREVTYDPATDELRLYPLQEYASLHTSILANTSTLPLSPALHYIAPTNVGADASDLALTFDLAPGAAASFFGAVVLVSPSVSGGVVFNVSVTATRPDGQRAVSLEGRALADLGPVAVGAAAEGSSAPILIDNATTHVELRVLVDRSSAEAFILGGRQAFTVTTNKILPANRTASGVALFGSAGTAATGTLHAMGCGWAEG